MGSFWPGGMLQVHSDAIAVPLPDLLVTGSMPQSVALEPQTAWP